MFKTIGHIWKALFISAAFIWIALIIALCLTGCTYSPVKVKEPVIVKQDPQKPEKSFIDTFIDFFEPRDL